MKHHEHTYRDRPRRDDNDLYVFLSYTSRESEVQALQPLVDEYCRGLWEWADQNGLHVFYDHFSLERRDYEDSELARLLTGSILDADLMTAFLSPEYIQSEWCQFEWAAQCAKVRGSQIAGDTIPGHTMYDLDHVFNHWNHPGAYPLMENFLGTLHDTQLARENGRSSATHAIYWKPDIWDHPYSFMLMESVCSARLTDVTDTYDISYSESISGAAGMCVHDSIEIISGMNAVSL